MLEISNAEYQVMQVLWQKQPLTAADIIVQLQQHKDWHEKTIKTLLNRLVSKGALSYQKEGRAYLYQPLIAEQDYKQNLSGGFITRFFAGKVTPLIASFSQQQAITADDLAELKQLIKKLEEEQKNA